MIDSFTGKYAFLSNFYHCRVTYSQISYRTAEHAYQTSKTLIHSERKRIRQCATPSLAKKFGRRTTLRINWDTIKLIVMRDIVKSKFGQNEELKRKLLATGDEQLVEGNWWNDTFWGVCQGEGENHLGRILMQTRKELQ